MPSWRSSSLSRSKVRRKASLPSAYPVTRSAMSSAVRGRSASSRAAVRFMSRSSLSDWAMALQRGDELLDALVVGPEGVLAEHRALGLIVELQVHPVDRVVALALLGLADELAPQAGPCGLRRGVDGIVDLGVVADPFDHAATLHLVEEAAITVDVVVLQIEQRHPRMVQREVVLLAVGLDEAVLDHPVGLAVETERVLLDLGEGVLPHVEGLLLDRREIAPLGVAECP